MLPRICSQPPCTNMLVTMLAQAGTICSRGASSAVPNRTAGTKPRLSTLSRSAAGGSEICHKKTIPHVTMISQTMTAVRRIGASSDSGIANTGQPPAADPRGSWRS